VLVIQELNLLKARINKQISVIEKDAKKKLPGDVDIYELRYADGKYVMPELLLAQAQVLNGLAVMRADG
jgi:hypothetical protein